MIKDFKNLASSEWNMWWIFPFFEVSSLMRTGSGMSAAAAAGVSPMSGLSSEKQSAVSAAAMQFPLTQRRKRRVLFTQAQVSKVHDFDF